MGVTGGIRPTARNLAHMAEQVPDVPHQWGVIGISREQWTLVAAALALGGNVRVGLEDNFYLPDGEMARSNGDLVAKARAMAQDAGRRVAHGRRDARAARDAEASAGMSALAGVRVLDLSRLLPGGFCSLLLADFGADVIKVEDTGMGDYVRGSAAPEAPREPGARFHALNRGKRSVRIDLKNRRGARRAVRLARDADVVLESFRPGVMERLGVGYERLREQNPRLVYCAITGYGQDGPYAARAGHDMNYLALVGLLGLTGDPDGAPIQAAGQIADLGGGALMAAVRDPRRAARARPLRRGPVRRRLDDRRRAVVAGDGRGARCSPAATAPRRGETAAGRRSALLPAVPLRRRLGRVRRAGAEVLARVVSRGRREDLVERQFEPRGVRRAPRGRGRVRGADPRSVGGVQRRARLLRRAGAGARRGARVRLVRRAAWWSRSSSPAAGRLLGTPVRLSRTPATRPRRRPVARRRHRRGAGRGRLSADEVAALKESGAVAGRADVTEASFLA